MASQPIVPPLFLTPEETAEALGCSRSQIFKMLLAGEVPSTKIGRLRRIPRVALEEMAMAVARGEGRYHQPKKAAPVRDEDGRTRKEEFSNA